MTILVNSSKLMFICSFLFALLLNICTTQASELNLSDKEKQWLSENPIIKVGVGVAFPPYMWVEEKEEQKIFKGMVSDYLNIFSKKLGVTFSPFLDIPFKESLEKGKRGEIDLFACLSETKERAAFLNFTEPYLSYPMVIITKENAPLIGGINDLRGKKISIVKHLAAFSTLVKKSPEKNFHFHFVNTVDQNLEAVSFGKADACIINLAVATYYIQKKGITNLKIASPADLDGIHLKMGIRKDSPMMLSIFQKVLNTIPQSDKDEISQKWIRVKYTPGIDVNLIKKWSLILSTVVAVIFFMFLFWNRKLSKEIDRRHVIEKDLRESRELFRDLVNTMSDWIWELDNKGRYTFCSNNVEGIMGYTPQEMIGKTPFDFMPRDKAGKIRKEFEIYLQNKSPIKDLENWNITKEGSEICILTNAAPILNKKGEITGYRGIDRDITENKQSNLLAEIQHKLAIDLSNTNDIQKRFELCLDAALESSGMDCGGIYLIGYESDGLDLIYHKGLPNGFVEATTQYSLDSENVKMVLKGEPIYSQHKDLGLQTNNIENIEELLAIAVIPILSKKTIIGSLNVASRKLQEIPLQSKNALETIASQIGNAINNFITEQKLQENEEKYRILFKSSSDAVFLIEVDSLKILEANKKAIDLYGYTYNELIGMTALSFSAQPDQNEMVIQKNQETAIHLRYHKKKDGTVFPVEITASYFKLQGKSINFSTVRDVSELKKIERQLNHSQKMESIGTLAGGIAHDFNNILTSIIGFAELSLLESEKGSVQEDNSKEILISGKRAKELVGQILSFARKSDDSKKPIQLSIIAKQVIKLLRSSLPSTINIKSKIESDSLIMGSETKVHQILMNICTNAAHAMSKSGGTLSFYLDEISIGENNHLNELDLETGSYIRIKISDTGLGIPPEKLNKIFEPYYTTKKIGEGTGLGLAVVQGIVESYDGKIRVTSELNRGSSFNVYLPITHKRGYSDNEYIPRELSKGNETILLVDDEKAIIKLGKRFLESIGYKVITETNSIEALKIFKANPENIDLVITDMTMPGMTGDILSEEILAVKPDVPIILCSGYNSKISEDMVKAIGIRRIYYKPVEQEKLSVAIRDVLSGC